MATEWIGTLQKSPFPFLEKRSKRKLGGALLYLPYAMQTEFRVSSGDTLTSRKLFNAILQYTAAYTASFNTSSSTLHAKCFLWPPFYTNLFHRNVN